MIPHDSHDSLSFHWFSPDISQLMTLEPSFDSPMVNVTVKEMATAILPCSVRYLGKHEVSAVHGERDKDKVNFNFNSV